MSASVPGSVPAVSRPLRFAILGMIEGNGHPWSWSAIINGFDRAKLAACPYPVIPHYMNAQPPGSAYQFHPTGLLAAPELTAGNADMLY